jgi:hypothetical protein
MLSFNIDHGTGTGHHATLRTHVTTCPRCRVGLSVTRNSLPPIDRCGFESYSLVCEHCGAGLAGIVDPADDALLLSVVQD